MDKAKAAVSNILSKSGHHDTTVHESVAPAVQKETIAEQRREEKQIVKDREVHQDHYHTSVQPVKDREVLPEQHHHQQVGVEHRTHDHRDHAATEHHLRHEAAQHKNETIRAPAAHTTSTAVPEVTGEHVHHHVHETVQPVIHKQTVEPHVVHTTVPVHEKHYNAAQHHTGHTLPAVDMADFKRQGGSLTGRDETFDSFKGEPRHLEKVLGGVAGTEHHHGTTGTTTGTTGTTGLGHATGNTHRTGDTATDAARHATEKHSKPSLLDKLNPKKDADGDGKAGFMH